MLPRCPRRVYVICRMDFFSQRTSRLEVQHVNESMYGAEAVGKTWTCGLMATEAFHGPSWNDDRMQFSDPSTERQNRDDEEAEQTTQTARKRRKNA